MTWLKPLEPNSWATDRPIPGPEPKTTMVLVADMLDGIEDRWEGDKC